MTWLEWLAATPPAMLLQRSGTAYLLVNAAHIAAIGVLVGAIVALDLRLLGMGRGVPLTSAGPYLSRLAAMGLGLAVLSGAWLFATQPDTYLDNAAFLAKLGLLSAGVLNALCLHAGAAWRQALQPDAAIPPGARLHAVVSLSIWLSAIVAGRWIGFL